MKKIKVLIVSVLAGSGHNSAADLLAQLLRKDERFDVIRYTNPSKLIDSTYNSMTKYTPAFHNFFVHHSPKFTSDVINLGKIDLVSDAIKQLQTYKPDLVIATHFTISYSYRIAEWITGFYPVNVCTFLDYGKQVPAMFPYNVYLRADYSIVYNDKAWQSVKDVAAQDDAYIIMGGHDCRDEFKEARKLYEDKVAARKALKEIYNTDFYQQLDTAKTTILLAGGGGGIIQKTLKLLKQISLAQKQNIELIDKYQFLIICGQNEKYFNKLVHIRNTRLSWQNIFPFAWLDAKKYALIQRSADYPVLFGIAPATMHELLETDCGPLVIHKVRADHEFENVNFVKSQKLGLYESDAEKVVAKIFSKHDPEKKQKFTQRATELLNTEDERFQKLPDELARISGNKVLRAEKIYHVSWGQRMASMLLVVLTLLVYYVTKILIWLDNAIKWLKKRFTRQKA